VVTTGREAQADPVRIAGLGTATPQHHVGSEELVWGLSRIWPSLARRLDGLVEQIGGGERFLARSPAEMLTQLRPGEQTDRYRAGAVELAEAAARPALRRAGIDPGDIGLLAVTSCTGFVLPGVDALLVPRLELREDVVRMPFAHFGCGGGAAALARAAEWVRGHPGERALVVAVELTSVTFRPADTSMDNLLSALVFGDGAGAAVLEAASAPDGVRTASGAPRSMGIGRVRSVLVPDTTEALGYQLVDDGLAVVLSRRLPALLERVLPPIVGDFVGGDQALAAAAPLAVHPGGPAILDAVERCLGVDRCRLGASWATLRRTGNTSSAGILFVLDALAEQPPTQSGTGLALAFGPGISVELLELVVC
jgi:alkylresorcinol/alkylpyrone synthase